MASSSSPAIGQLSAAARTFLALTVILGLVYPLTMTGVAQVLFPENANGSMVETGEGVVGSELIGQAFTKPATDDDQPATGADGSLVQAPDPAYFQSRPSAAGAGYDPLASSASNYGPENPDLIALVEERRAAATQLDGGAGSLVPPDALLASGSGLDPHISPEYAQHQIERVARVRRLEPGPVRDLVEAHTEGRVLGFLGEPRVNVLILNLALDDLADGQHEADSE